MPMFIEIAEMLYRWTFLDSLCESYLYDIITYIMIYAHLSVWLTAYMVYQELFAPHMKKYM